jgi:hypothetical protein
VQNPKTTQSSGPVFAEYGLTGEWKFTYWLNDIPELYNLKSDPKKLHNLAAEPEHRSRVDACGNNCSHGTDPLEAQIPTDAEGLLRSAAYACRNRIRGCDRLGGTTVRTGFFTSDCALVFALSSTQGFPMVRWPLYQISRNRFGLLRVEDVAARSNGLAAQVRWIWMREVASTAELPGWGPYLNETS